MPSGELLLTIRKCRLRRWARNLKTDDIFDPNKVKVVFSAQGTALYFSRSAIPYCRGAGTKRMVGCYFVLQACGLYAYRPQVLKEITMLTPGILEKAESLEHCDGWRMAIRLR